MVAQPKFKPVQPRSTEELAKPRLEAADAHHHGIHSPALDLQARLSAAISYPSTASAAITNDDRWPGAVRVTILLGGAAGGWALVWQAVRLMIA